MLSMVIPKQVDHNAVDNGHNKQYYHNKKFHILYDVPLIQIFTDVPKFSLVTKNSLMNKFRVVEFQ